MPNTLLFLLIFSNLICCVITFLQVELLVRAHHFYMSSAALDAIDVLLSLAATRVESYISEGDFTSLARLVTGINNFQSLHFMLDILIENGQLELLLQKRAVVEAAMESSASVRGFRMAVLSTLKHFNPHDLDAFAMVSIFETCMGGQLECLCI